MAESRGKTGLSPWSHIETSSVSMATPEPNDAKSPSAMPTTRPYISEALTLHATARNSTHRAASRIGASKRTIEESSTGRGTQLPILLYQAKPFRGFARILLVVRAEVDRAQAHAPTANIVDVNHPAGDVLSAGRPYAGTLN
jgi:hypothetical protein